MGLKAAASPWDVMDVAIASNKFRESYFDPANLNRPINWGFSGDFNLFNALEGLGNKIANACEWGKLAGCIIKEYGKGLLEEAPLVLIGEISCAVCYGSFEPISKTGFCIGCGIYRWSSGTRAMADLVDIIGCVDKHCEISLLQQF